MVTPKVTRESLNVLMNGHPVGVLKKNSQGQLSFRYNESWLNTPGARPISLALPLLNKPFKAPIVRHFFEQLLPQDTQFNTLLKAHFKTHTIEPFDLLKILGKECVGAIQLIPGRMNAFQKKMRFEPITDKEIATRLRAPQKYPLGLAATQDTFRHVLPGTHTKSAFLYYEDTWARPRSHTPTSHILKRPKDHYALENEWLSLKIAEAFGLPVASAHLLHFEEVQALAIKRFDRQYSADKTWLMRRPQETIKQALGILPANETPGIQHTMRFLLGSANPIHDRDVFYCSQILFWLLAATDGHADNFSVFIQPEGKYQLAPLYDISSRYPDMARAKQPKASLKMAMPLLGQRPATYWHDIKREHFLETAKKMQYSTDRAEAILDDMLSRVDTVITQVSSSLPPHFPQGVSDPIFKGMQFVKQKLSAKNKVH